MMGIILFLGYLRGETGEALFSGRILSPAEVLQFQQPDPVRGWWPTIQALSKYPEPAPLDFLIGRGGGHASPGSGGGSAGILCPVRHPGSRGGIPVDERVVRKGTSSVGSRRDYGLLAGASAFFARSAALFSAYPPPPGIQRADTWWNKSISAGNKNVAQLANRAERPLIAARNGDFAKGEIISLACYLDEGVRMMGLPAGVERVQPGDLGDVFLLTPSD